MGRRLFGSRSKEVPDDLRRAGQAFASTLACVEDAKASLVSSVRAGRAPGAPLAEALAGFESGLAEADALMPSWRAAEVEEVWGRCTTGLAHARRRAGTFRTAGDPPGVYEELIAALEDLMDPLDPFEDAANAWRSLGVRV
jgi:hypothetical protein